MNALKFGASLSAGSSSRSRSMQDNKNTPFGKARGRFSIGSLDEPQRLTVTAQYNPKELQYERAINWKQGDLRDNRPDWLRERSSRAGLADNFEYSGADTRSMSFELLLDGYEDNVSVEPQVRMLEEMACVRDPDTDDDSLRRPHHCVVIYGPSGEGFGKLRCVITKLAVKYSMFNSMGVPLRASVNITVKEAYNLHGFNIKMDEAAKKSAKERAAHDKALAKRAAAKISR